jgi:hypothetical protein
MSIGKVPITDCSASGSSEVMTEGRSVGANAGVEIVGIGAALGSCWTITGGDDASGSGSAEAEAVTVTGG